MDKAKNPEKLEWRTPNYWELDVEKTDGSGAGGPDAEIGLS